MPEGVVAELWRYPVKSMAGEPLRSARVDWRGMGGDRTHAVLFDSKTGRRPLTAREASGLLEFHASYPFASDAGLDPTDPPVAQVRTPDGQKLSWPDPRLRRRLQEAFGRELTMERRLDGMQDLGQTLLVPSEATRGGLEDELGRPIDIRRFRPNVHLELDGEPAWAE